MRAERIPYFTATAGTALVRAFEFLRPVRGVEVLDLGCGPGFLSSVLLDAGATVSASDNSIEAIEAVNARLKGRPGWRGGQLSSGSLPWPAASFEAAFCIEVVEHVDDVSLDAILGEIYRVLKIGGTALFSTPNEEDLSENSSYCPRCNVEFHRWGHLRTWSAALLSARLEQQGFEILFCSGVDLDRFQEKPRKPWQEISFVDLRGCVGEAVAAGLDAVCKRRFPNCRRFQRRLATRRNPHLVAIVRRA
jgi:2-polyprenyl-3-methyl-5-hydroxy-6-metoxy-1,4-benzoquinol methylase